MPKLKSIAMRLLGRSGGDASCRGVVTIHLALMIVAIIGSVSLGTEVVIVYMKSRQMQSAADAAALGAVTARIEGYPADYTQEAFALTNVMGFTNGQNGTIVTVGSPQPPSNFVGVSDAVEVRISQPQKLALANVVYPGPMNVGVRAVARVSGNAPTLCLLVLDPTAGSAYAQSGGNTIVNLNNCDLAVNSNNPQAVNVSGGGTLNVNHVSVVGGTTVTGGGTTINATNGITTAAPATPDPYASYVIPTYSGCYKTNYKPTTNDAPLAGVYCGGMNLTQNNITVNLSGTYILDQGNFQINNQTTVTGTNVTIILTSSGANPGSKAGLANITAAATNNISLSAPTSGPLAGMLIFQDRSAPTGGNDTISGTGNLNLTGALYFPQQTVKYSSDTTVSQCTQIVARMVPLSNSATLNGNCAGTGVPSGGGLGSLAVLVE